MTWSWGRAINCWRLKDGAQAPQNCTPLTAIHIILHVHPGHNYCQRGEWTVAKQLYCSDPVSKNYNEWLHLKYRIYTIVIRIDCGWDPP